MKSNAKKTLLVLDGQGGGLGRKIAERLLAEAPDFDFIAVGTNAAATSNMMKAGITAGATGENAWLHNCARADILVGPMGVVLANSMHGEISPAMAQAVADSPAEKLLIPVQHRHITILGLPDAPLHQYLDALVKTIKSAGER